MIRGTSSYGEFTPGEVFIIEGQPSKKTLRVILRDWYQDNGEIPPTKNKTLFPSGIGAMASDLMEYKYTLCAPKDHEWKLARINGNYPKEAS